ncbi:hypothetical protein JTE90_010728 [Oedothorax gibbosus]|uniref:Uncharacterized protein n=1 Tax=Oedothorax gibbosus TaxID=931172 RepID=A0AAV6UQU6_9ARAC|nr:hypothetical protein JTE90_010728 [Oedothorax gibbosus]
MLPKLFQEVKEDKLERGGGRRRCGALGGPSKETPPAGPSTQWADLERPSLSTTMTFSGSPPHSLECRKLGQQILSANHLCPLTMVGDTLTRDWATTQNGKVVCGFCRSSGGLVHPGMD